MLVRMASGVQVGTLRRVISWIEIGLGLPITAFAAWGVYESRQIAPYDQSHGGAMLLMSAVVVGGIGVNLLCVGIGLRCQRPVVRWLAHVPLLAVPFIPSAVILVIPSLNWGSQFLTR